MAWRVDSLNYVENTLGGDIVIDGFEKGIADSPYLGISDIRHLNISSVPLEASVIFSTSQQSFITISNTFTVSNSGGNILVTATGTNQGLWVANMAVTVSNSGGSLPGNLSANTTYYVINVSSNTFNLATTATGSAIAYSSAGTGTQTITTIDMGSPTYGCTELVAGASGSVINYYIVDINGRAWANVAAAANQWVFLNNTTRTNGAGNGVVAYHGYLFIFRNRLIDYISTSGTIFSNSWTFGWQTMNAGASSGLPHQALVGQDDVAYYTDSQWVGSFTQKAGQVFDPSNSATYTWAQQALALPSTDSAQCLAELGINLMVGGIKNAIYPWNRTSTSFTYPILVAENNIKRIVTVNTNSYIFAGARGRVYITNGSQAILFKKVPDHLSGTVEPYFTWGDAAANKNTLYFSFSVKDNGGTVINQYGGLWAINLESQAITQPLKLSYNTYAGVANVIIINLSATATGLGDFIGWDSGASTYGVDTTQFTPYSNYEPYVDSDFIPIGTFLKRKTFDTIEFKLIKPMVAGEKIKISYRTDLSQSFTQLGETTAAVLSDYYQMNFDQVQWIQFRVNLSSTASSPSYVRLKEIRIR